MNPRCPNWSTGMVSQCMSPSHHFPAKKLEKASPQGVRWFVGLELTRIFKGNNLSRVFIYEREVMTCHDHHVGSLTERWTLSLPLSWLGPVAEKIQSYSSGGRWVGFQHLIRQGMRVVIRGNLEFKVGEGSVKCKIIRLQPS